MEAAQLALVSGGPGLVVVEGAVSRITFSNPDTGFAIVRIANEERPVKGTFGRVAVGDSFRIEGTEEQHAKFGRQILATKIVPRTPTGHDGIACYLGTLPGVGEALAQRIAARFGERAVERLIEDPEAVAKVIKGLTPSKAWKAAERAKEKAEEREILVYLFGIGLSPAYAARVLKAWGSKSQSIIRTNPFRLAREISGIGFAMADSIARNLGISEDALERREAAILHVLGEAAGSGARYKKGDRERSTGGGHCFLPRPVLCEVAAQLLALPPETMDVALAALETEGAVVLQDRRAEDDAVYGAALHRAEAFVAEKIDELMRERHPPPPAAAPGSKAAKVAEIFSDEQRSAVALVRTAGVVVLTGGPGVGKTSVTRAVIEEWEQGERKVLLCSPTGRAAKRMTEATGRPASTIHRLLGWQGDQGPQVGERNPLQCDLLVVDEASMLDVVLARHLLAAIPVGASLLLVGDVDQLPSVGAGQVLHDVIASGRVPVAHLSRIFRQAAGSEISAAAAAVLRGAAPTSGGELVVWPVIEDEQESAGQMAQREIVRAVTEYLPRQGFNPRDIQVLTPMHKGAAGTQELNRALQAALNPTGAEFARGPHRVGIRVGDPVLQTKNDYDLGRAGVMNGDLGRVVAIDPSIPSVTCRFDEEEVVCEKDAIAGLELSYAMSIHKSQGGEYPCVVLAFLGEHFVMARKNLLYTAITRGKKRVLIVGQKKILALAARTPDTSTRNTGLRQRLAQMIGDRPARRVPVEQIERAPDPIVAVREELARITGVR